MISEQIEDLKQMNEAAMNLAASSELDWNLFRITSPFQLKEIIKISKNNNLDIFCPFEVLVKRSKKHTKKKIRSIRPLLPGYFYLHRSQRLPSSIDKMIVQPLFHGDEHLHSPASQLIKFHNSTNDYSETRKVMAHNLKKQDKVQIVEGPFQWLEGTIEDFSVDTASVKLIFMNREQILNFPVSFLEKVC